MKNEEKNPVGSLVSQKVLEDKRDRDLDFIVDLLIVAFVVFIVVFSTFGLQPFIEFIKNFCNELLY